jgi:tetratricopeptide (TPR) repeat protein
MGLLDLVMIVKNSGVVIEKVLNEIKPYIDHWTILDTGSTDGTQERIRDCLKGVNGKLYEEPFIDFPTSRNRSIELAGTRCKYAIILDDSYLLKGGDNLRKLLSSKPRPSYAIRIVNIIDSTSYYSTRIIETSRGFRYDVKYRVHEFLDTNNDYIIKQTDIELTDAYDQNMLYRSKHRFSKDLILLKQDLVKYPNDSRLVFYIAKTLVMLDKHNEALEYFERRVKLTRPDEETYHSLNNIWDIKINKQKKPYTSPDVLNVMTKVMKEFPNRAEPFYNYACLLYRNGEHKKAYVYAKQASSINVPNNTMLEIQQEIYSKHAPYLYADLSIRLDKINDAVETIKKQLELFPTDPRLHNMKLLLTNMPDTSTKFEKPSVVIQAGVLFDDKNWDPSNVHANASGSELMAVKMATQLAKTGKYRVFVFGSFDKDQQNINGVEYIHHSLYLQFCNKYHINYLVVSRDIDNIYYAPSVDNVYLWVHDVLPHNSDILQTHTEKFKKIMVLCKWHKNFVQDYYKLPDDMFYVTRNAIDEKRFVNRDLVQKTPFRFIYTSSPDRGLSEALNLFPSIKEKYPQATFEIFCDRRFINGYDIEKIESMKDYVNLNGRVSQEQLSIELLKSDVWFYPTIFDETYCISAVEAQAAGCLCVSISRGSLSEIIADRGVLVSDSNRKKLLPKMFEVLDNPDQKDKIVNRAKQWAMKQTFESLTNDWIALFTS